MKTTKQVIEEADQMVTETREWLAGFSCELDRFYEEAFITKAKALLLIALVGEKEANNHLLAKDAEIMQLAGILKRCYEVERTVNPYNN